MKSTFLHIPVDASCLLGLPILVTEQYPRYVDSIFPPPKSVTIEQDIYRNLLKSIYSFFPRGLGATVEALGLKVMKNECIQIILISLITSERAFANCFELERRLSFQLPPLSHNNFFGSLIIMLFIFMSGMDRATKAKLKRTKYRQLNENYL